MQRRSIPLVKQGNRNWCGPACLCMAYNYLNPDSKKNIKDIVKELESLVGSVKEGTYESELGIYALKNGFYSRRICYDSDFYKREYLRWNQERILKDFKKRFRNSKSNDEPGRLKAEIRYLNLGGVLKVKIPECKDLEEIIKKDAIPIVSMDRKIFYGHGLGSAFHFVVVNNINEDGIIMNDPADRITTCKTYKFLFALWSSEGSILEIGRKV